MENDDLPIGRILSRREVLKILGVGGAALLAACMPGTSEILDPGSAPTRDEVANAPTVAVPDEDSGVMPACVVRPETTEGPYYLDEELERMDIRADTSTGEVKVGALLTLTFNVSQVASGGCTPLEGSKVEIWHCDAGGVYSGVSDPGFDSSGQNFLRGYQIIGADGKATFMTIYPGWYPGRCIHIHFKIHHDTSERSVVFTSQLFFDDAFSDQVFTREPYANRGQRNTLNSSDRIYDDQLLLNVRQDGEGYAATFEIGLQAV